jgi:hypothetical protein
MRKYRRRTRPQYLLPFLALVGFGVFLILAFQLWGNFFPNAKGDAVFYIADGRSKVLSFGTAEWVNEYNGSKIKLGDSVKTLHGGRGLISFYDGTLVRMDEDTQVTLVDITKKDDYQEILLYLNQGKVYVNKPKENVIRKTDFVINTNYASYSITGTIFDLEKLTDETLRVLRGSVQADILEVADGKTRTIESIPVGIGQELVLNDASMKEFYQRQSPSVLTATDVNFEATDWAMWNAKEDENPTNFAKGGGSTTIIEDNQASLDNTIVPIVTPDDLSALPAPTLVSPKTNSMSTTVDTQTISGKASEGVKKILLKQTLAGSDTVQKILISNFDTDKLTWSYSISEAKGNIKVGSNSYVFVGVDENAKETAPLIVAIDYQKDSVSEPDLANNNVAGSSVALEKPKLLQVDGKPYKEGMTVSKDGFIISGSVAGASEMWVDDFKLNKFQAGGTSWSYNIKVSYGNLKPGLNSYQVFGKDANGKQSSILTVKLNYTAPAVAPVTMTTSISANSSASTSAVTVESSPVASLNSDTSSTPVVAEPVVHY